MRVRPQVSGLHLDNHDRVISDEGFEYKPFQIYSVSDTKFRAHPSDLFKLEGTIVARPGTQAVTLIATKLIPSLKETSIDTSKLFRLKSKLDALGKVEDKVKWILGKFFFILKAQEQRKYFACSFPGISNTSEL